MRKGQRETGAAATHWPAPVGYAEQRLCGLLDCAPLALLALALVVLLRLLPVEVCAPVYGGREALGLRHRRSVWPVLRPERVQGQLVAAWARADQDLARSAASRRAERTLGVSLNSPMRGVIPKSSRRRLPRLSEGSMACVRLHRGAHGRMALPEPQLPHR